MATSIGTGRQEFWSSLLLVVADSVSSELWIRAGTVFHVGAEIQNFRPEDYVHKLDPHSIGRSSQLAIAAARLAITDGALDLTRVDVERAGVCAGTTSGEPHFIERFDDHYVQGELKKSGREFITHYPCHVVPLPCGHGTGIFRRNHDDSHSLCCRKLCDRPCQRSAPSREGRHHARRWCGFIFSITYTGFARLGAIAPEICQPFDRNRKGMVPGEGAAMPPA